ncbi:unnamed protein product [Lepidochelys kempii]
MPRMSTKMKQYEGVASLLKCSLQCCIFPSSTCLSPFFESIQELVLTVFQFLSGIHLRLYIEQPLWGTESFRLPLKSGKGLCIGAGERTCCCFWELLEVSAAQSLHL